MIIVKNLRLALLAVAVALGCATAQAQLVVDMDLGTIGLGSYNITGDTNGGPNNAENYFIGNDGLYWGSERVYQFTIPSPAAYSISLNSLDLGADLDFYLLDSLATAPAGANGDIYASGLVTFDYLDTGAFPRTGATQILNAGTYFLAVDSYSATTSGVPGMTGAFDLNVDLVAPPAPPTGAVDLGILQGLSSINTLSSPDDVDTELGIYDSLGNLVAINDDAGGVFQSELFAPNVIGNYFLALGGFNTVFNGGFAPTSTSTEAGSVQIDYTNGSGAAMTEGPFALAAGEIRWYEFEIDTVAAVPPPAVDVDLGTIANDGEALSFDTIGSLNPNFAGTANPEIDSLLGLYDAAGVLIDSNDDIDGTSFSSLIDLPAGLAAGTYYLSMTGAAATLGEFFQVTSTSDEIGDWDLNYLGLTEEGTLVAGQVVWFEFAIGSDVLAGDFNGDGVVNAADYTVWRDTENETGAGLAADANGDMVVDSVDYAIWRSNFGQTAGSLSVGDGGAVPEPATVCLALCGVALLGVRSLRKLG